LKDSPEVLACWREEMKEQGKRNDLCDNITEVKEATGTSKAYTLSRLKRENAELFQQVVAGELSANAAAQAKEASRSAKAAELVRAGTHTQAEAAREIGVSKQAVSKAASQPVTVKPKKVDRIKTPVVALSQDPTLTAKNILAKMGREPFTL
jgi:hypothetical protein